MAMPVSALTWLPEPESRSPQPVKVGIDVGPRGGHHQEHGGQLGGLHVDPDVLGELPLVDQLAVERRRLALGEHHRQQVGRVPAVAAADTANGAKDLRFLGLDRHVALEALVPGEKHLAHASLAEGAFDAVGAEPLGARAGGLVAHLGPVPLELRTDDI